MRDATRHDATCNDLESTGRVKPAVLLIHGFTGHHSSLGVVESYLKQQGYRYEYPILAGHGTRPEDLADKRWSDWQEDVEGAYQKLRQSHDRIVIIALSMGTLLALQLASKHQGHVAGLVLLSPAIKFMNRLAPLTPLVQPLVRRFPFPGKNKFSTAEGAAADRGYQWFPTAAYRSYWEQTRSILSIAATVTVPTRIIHSRADNVADPRGATSLAAALGGPHELFWHEHSGHELLLDVEAESVLEEVVSFPPLSDG